MDRQRLCDLIQQYFIEGLQYDEILAFLLLHHNTEIGVRTLK